MFLASKVGTGPYFTNPIMTKGVCLGVVLLSLDEHAAMQRIHVEVGLVVGHAG